MRESWSDIEERRQRSEQGLRRVFALAVLVAMGFLGWSYFSDGPSGTVSSEPALEATLIEQPVMRPPVVIDRHAPPYRAPAARPGRESYVGVYECVEDGQRVVSDRPCGPSAQTRTLVVDQPDPRDVARQQQQTWAAQQAVPNAYPQSGSAGAVPSAGTPTARSNEAACRNINEQIARIDERMRQRYTSQQGERYREQLRALRQQRYDLRCSR